MKKLTKILIISALLGNLIVMAFTFYTAFFNNYQVTIFINKYNEAWIEAILFPLTLIFGTYLLFNEFKEKDE